MYRKLATAATIAAAVLFARAPLAEAQKALVYCPVGVDATGCNRIVTALTASFAEGVDRGYDGRSGTVDLAKIDLQHYSVFVVPSLADDGDKQPYALLRSVSSRLQFAINGRVAVFSGAPDQGSNNRPDKDVLIQNLARWASAGHTRKASLVGMVAFLDLSEDEAARYSWVRSISVVDVSADVEDQSINDATAVGTRGGELLKVGSRDLNFANMASNGLHIGNKGAARTEVAAMGGSTSRQSILVTYANADGPTETSGSVGNVGTGASFNRTAGSASFDATGATSSLASGPTLTTDKPDYMPGETVTFTGTGFAPGDTVTITVHEDPTWSYPDRQFKSVADASGGFVNRQMVIDQQDLGAAFTATAIGNPSGIVAQTTFTDGIQTVGLATADNAAPATMTWQVTWSTFGASGGVCIGNPTAGITTFTGALKDGGGNNNLPSANQNQSEIVTGASATGTFATQFAFNYWSDSPTSTTPVSPVCTGGAQQGQTPIGSPLYAHFRVAAQTTNITISSSSLNSTYATNVTFTATASVANAAGSIQFQIDGANFGPVQTLSAAATSTATISTAALSAATHPVTAVFTPGTGFLAGTVNTINQVVSQKSVTVATLTVSNKVYDGTTAATLTGGTLSGVVAGDEPTVGLNIPAATATFINKNVGNGKTVNVSGLALTGAAAGNYSLSSTTGATTANITALGVTGSITTNNKVYDGNTTAAAQASSVVTAISGDAVNLAAGTLTFDTKNVGTSKPVTASGYTLSGADAGNYQLGTVTATNANITPLGLTAAITADSKVYDGTAAAAVHDSPLAGKISGDAVALAVGAGTFADKAVGTNKTVTAPVSLTGTDAGNYTLAASTASATANITARTLLISATGVDKPYDGTTAATVTLSDNRIANDVFTDAYTTAAFADKSVGTGKTVSVSGISISGTDAGNYAANTTAITTANITPRALVVTATGVNKVYDGNTTATVTLGDNRVSGDVFTDAFTTAAFANKNVGTGKSVSVSGISISGTDAGNYTANTTATATADITARTLAVTATGVNKVYDATIAATVTFADNRVSGDVFTTGFTSATFADKHVGTAKTISVIGISLSGTDASNYTPNGSTSTTADITARALIVSATASNKTYDGNANASVTLSDNRVSGDVFTTSHTSATFSDKNVGTGKTVTISGISLAGADAGDYTFNTTATATANITALAISGAVTANNKVYDGTTAASIATRTLSGALGGDDVHYSAGAATFADKNVGTSKTVTVTGLSLSGADAGNYTVNATATTTADITRLGVTGSITTSNKVYDGSATATAPTSALGVVGKISGDYVNLSGGTLAFGDKNVGTAKPVTASGWTLAGGDAGNYLLGAVTASAADITPLAISGNITAQDKVYNGNTAATILTRTLTGVLGTDAVSYTGGTATFADKNVGTHKAVSATGLSLSGADAGNYSVNGTATANAEITPKALIVSATGVNKVYDGTTTASVTLGDDRVSGDVFTANYASASFADKNVGTAKAVSVSGISLTGADAGNYTFNTTASTMANITPKALVVSAHGVNKIYDGNTTASVTLTDDRVSGDVFTDAFTTATFNNKNVGSGKTVSVSGISISGMDAGNYTANMTATTTADITARTLAITATGVNKVYDGTTAATVTLADNRVSGDVFSATYTATFADKNVGTGKPVSVSGISISGADAGNYTHNSSTATTADITVRTLAVTATAANKVYDGNATASVTLADNRVAGDVFTDAFTSATFADKNVGMAKTVTVSGISITGVDAGNYAPNTTTTTTANITALGITGSITASNKVYDATTAATIATRTLSGQISGDAVAYSGGTATFNNKNVGTGKPVAGTGLGLSGSDAGNYTVNSTASTTGDITQRALTVSATGKNKVYDNNTDAEVTLNDDRVSGDALTDSYAAPATFASKNVGNGIGISVTGISISGADAANYTFNTTAAAAANITKRPVTVTVDNKQVVWTGASITPPYTIGLTTGSMAGGETFSTTLGIAAYTPPTVTNVGSYSVNVTGLTNANYMVSTVLGTVTVLDQSKPIGTITSLNPVPLNTGATLQVNFNDVASGNSNITAWKYSIDGVASAPIAVSGTPNFNTSATLPPFNTTDVKQVCVSGQDAGGNSSLEVCALLAIYDPSAGFVTGGGWITSPAGAYAADPTLTGKANFGFNSKYQKGANVPTGNTEFQFQAGNLNFSSTNFQWLVIQGTTQSQFKGTGTINGTGKYNFLVTAIDGDNFNGTKKPDAFRIKITDFVTGAVVYDNQMGKDDSGADATALGGGSIVIHDK